jgi:hypothetical protein
VTSARPFIEAAVLPENATDPLASPPSIEKWVAPAKEPLG